MRGAGARAWITAGCTVPRYGTGLSKFGTAWSRDTMVRSGATAHTAPQTAVVAPTGQTQLRHRELAPRGTGVAADRTCAYRSIAATGRGGAPRGPAAGWGPFDPSRQRLEALPVITTMAFPGHHRWS